MANKFSDELAEKALIQAMHEHEAAKQDLRSLLDEQSAAHTRLNSIEAKLKILDQQVANPRLAQGADISPAAIEQHVREQTDRRAELDREKASISQKLRLFKQAVTQRQANVSNSKNVLETARAALAASYERHMLRSREFENAMKLLQSVRAVWMASIDEPGWFDAEGWLISILDRELPSDKEMAAARKLLKVENA